MLARLGGGGETQPVGCQDLFVLLVGHLEWGPRGRRVARDGLLGDAHGQWIHESTEHPCVPMNGSGSAHGVGYSTVSLEQFCLAFPPGCAHAGGEGAKESVVKDELKSSLSEG